MISFPNCKINIGLHVLSKREDGYHNIETTFYPLPIHDVLEMVPAENWTMHQYGLKIEGILNDNIISKAIELMSCDYPIPPTQTALFKAIPMGAGLGGGSSDGAFALKLLNDLYHLNCTAQQLKKYASQLGSDCAFFIDGIPAYATGRGELLEPIELDLKGWHFVLVKPNIHVSTADAYRDVQKRGNEMASKLKNDLKQPVEAWKDLVENDFEHSVFKMYPAIAEIKMKLYQVGAVYASMSGSGSSVYGLFKSPIHVGSTFSDAKVYTGIF